MFFHAISRITGVITLIGLAVGLTSCAVPGITPGLTGTSYHTGTLTILRVDDAWHPDPEQRAHYKVGSGIQKKRGRFVPLRGKTDIAGLDGPDRIVTKDDLITITLNSAFIKFFKESLETATSGEIAVVLSFSAGSTVQENLLIHSSRGQTLGSFLDLQDWPVVGPVQIDGDSLLVRIVIIELDQQENEQKRQAVRALAGIGTTINPGLGPVFSITQQVADFIISQNSDDVIFDQKFSFHRVDFSIPATRSPLLYGKYVLLMQEDKFVKNNAKTLVPRSTLPPKIDDMRYDTEFDRVSKVYNYFPLLELSDEQCKSTDKIEVQKEFLSTFLNSLYEGVGRIDYSSFYPQPDEVPEAGDQEGTQEEKERKREHRRCMLKKLVNGNVAQNIRKSDIGYREPVVGEIELFPSLDIALKVAFLDGIRHSPSAEKDVNEFQKQLGSLFGDARPPGEIPYNYPVTQYPEAFTLVAQYPLHTYLVFSIDRSLGGDGQKFHERFQTFVDFMNTELQSTRDNDQINTLADAIDRTVRTRKTQRALLKRVDRLKKRETETQEHFEQRRVCILWQAGLRPSGGNAGSPLSDAPIYNEIFHITGQSFGGRGEVTGYLIDNGWKVDEKKHTCTDPASTETSSSSS